PAFGDNCPLDDNTDQVNHDGDAYDPLDSSTGGDVCDDDDDNDTILDDGDASGGVGDNRCRGHGSKYCAINVCTDDEMFAACDDNCQFAVNPEQIDIDRDTLGNVCDDDMDGDTITNNPAMDNCPFMPNEDQMNFDFAYIGVPFNGIEGDEYGDECDPDDDADATLDFQDNCPYSRGAGVVPGCPDN
ncbi:MAG: thrombospondin type 3 repeat-containing protein, partial [bacterium]